jgi:hypothetical protein
MSDGGLLNNFTIGDIEHRTAWLRTNRCIRLPSGSLTQENETLDTQLTPTQAEKFNWPLETVNIHQNKVSLI